MDVDEDDDFYAPEEDKQTGGEDRLKIENAPQPDTKTEEGEDLEEGEEEGEAGSDGSDSVRFGLWC